MNTLSEVISDRARELLKRSVVVAPQHLSDVPSWQGHIPFAFLLVDLLRPRCLVELGTHKGDSYCAFCEAVERLDVGTRCHAVDTWMGDAHAGSYESTIYDTLRAYHDPRYGSFSRLLRMTFDEAHDEIADASVDVLHIDGLHTYEAVRHDFEFWEAKLSDRAIVLFHDTQVRTGDFGVFQFWDELRARFPVREFRHSNGLGVLAYGTHLPDDVKRLFETSDDEWADIELIFERLGSACSHAGETRRMTEMAADLLREREHARRAFEQAQSSADRLSEAADRLRGELAAERKLVEILKGELANVSRELDMVKSSTSWRVTEPLRSFYLQYPRVALASRNVAKVGYWTMRGQLVGRLKASVAYRLSRAQGQEGSVPRLSAPQDFLKTYLSWRWPLLSTDYVHDLSGFIEKADLGSLDPSSFDRKIAQLAERAGSHVVKAKPDVSIIVPVHNALAHTLACLESILVVGGQVSFEIIVADDQSSDRTHELIPQIGGVVRHIRHDTNLGFLRNCNAAAEQARGGTLVFLNNDTIVLPGWLDELLRPFEDQSGVGLTCAKLLESKGTLQEAGGIFWSDGSAWNYGRGSDPRHYAFNFTRDTDYGSGAALAIQATVWSDVGGFDDHFAPAYCEDADLAFRLRDRGYRTIYTPFAEVIHHEGVSHGRDERVGIKAHQVTNLAKLKQRWSRQLSDDHYPSGQKVAMAASRSRHRIGILVVDHYVPQFDRDAGSRAMHGYIKLLVDSGFHVTFWPANEAFDPVYGPIYQRMGVELVYETGKSGGFKSWIKQRGDDFAYAFLCRPHIAATIIGDLRHHSRAKILFFGVDLHALRMKAEGELHPSPQNAIEVEQIARQEMTIWQTVDAIYYPSHSEADYVKEQGIATPVRALPLFMFGENDFPQPVSSMISPERGDLQITFVGGFRHRPNSDGIVWFHHEIWPRIREAYPDARCNVVGANPPLDVLSLAASDFLIRGHVSDKELDATYRSTCVVVAPLRFGAGVKGKVVEALRFGLPIVTTSAGAQGIDGIESVCAVTDDPERFAESVVSLLSSETKRQQQAAAGQALVRRLYSIETVCDVLAKDIPELRPAPSVHG